MRILACGTDFICPHCSNDFFVSHKGWCLTSSCIKQVRCSSCGETCDVVHECLEEGCIEWLEVPIKGEPE